MSIIAKEWKFDGNFLIYNGVLNTSFLLVLKFSCEHVNHGTILWIFYQIAELCKHLYGNMKNEGICGKKMNAIF